MAEQTTPPHFLEATECSSSACCLTCASVTDCPSDTSCARTNGATIRTYTTRAADFFTSCSVVLSRLSVEISIAAYSSVGVRYCYRFDFWHSCSKVSLLTHILIFCRGGRGSRTHDLLLAKQTLFHLSYAPILASPTTQTLVFGSVKRNATDDAYIHISKHPFFVAAITAHPQPSDWCRESRRWQSSRTAGA